MKGLRFSNYIILVCIRWYMAYALVIIAADIRLVDFVGILVVTYK